MASNWTEALRGISGAEAFSLINDPKRELTQKQRDALWALWGKLKYGAINAKQERLAEKWGTTDAWR
jgi:hypothetical protein